MVLERRIMVVIIIIVVVTVVVITCFGRRQEGVGLGVVGREGVVEPRAGR